MIDTATGSAAALSPVELAEKWFEVVSLGGGHNTNVVLAGVTLLGLAAGMVGVFSMLKKQSLVADAFAHASLAGVGAAFLLHGAFFAGGGRRNMAVLLLGAALSGSLAVAAISWLGRRTRLPADTATAAVSSASFGLGIVLLSLARRISGADQAGLDGLIFGSAASMTRGDAQLMAAVAGIVLIAVLGASAPLTAAAFNERFARVRGLPVGFIEALLAALVAAITIAGLQAVGMLLVVAMLVIPPATARLWTRRVPGLLTLSGLLGASAAFLGASVSAILPNAPAGALIILVSAASFAISLIAAPHRGLVAGLIRQRAVRHRARAEAHRPPRPIAGTAPGTRAGTGGGTST